MNKSLHNKSLHGGGGGDSAANTKSNSKNTVAADAAIAAAGLLSRFGGGGGGGGIGGMNNKSNHGGGAVGDLLVMDESATPSSPSPIKTPLSARNPDDVSKEELLEILKKMNGRVKALSQSRTQLAEKVKSIESDKDRLLALLKNEILDEGVIAEAVEKVTKLTSQQQQPQKEGGAEVDEIFILQTAWRDADERNQLQLQHIQNEYKIITLQAQAEVEKVRAAITAEKDGEIKRMKEDMNEAVTNMEKDGAFMMPTNDGGDSDMREYLQRKDEEIAALKDEIQSLYAASTVNGGEGSDGGSKDEEIATLKKENHGLKVKFKGHIEKINAFKEKVAVELKNAKEEVTASANAADEAKRALEEALTSRSNDIPTEVLDEKNKRIDELIEEVERVKRELICKHELEVKEALERGVTEERERSVVDLNEMQFKAQKHLDETIERVRAETTALMEERLSDVIASAKMEAANSASTELRLSLENKYNVAMAVIDQEHTAAMEDQRQRLVQEHMSEVEVMNTNTQSLLEKMRSEEVARYQSELEMARNKVREEVKSQFEAEIQEQLVQVKAQLAATHTEEMKQLRETLIAESERISESKLDMLTKDLNTMHNAELGRVKSELMTMAKSSQSEEIETLVAAHKDEVAQLRSELEATVFQAVENESLAMKSIHSQQIELLRQELQSSAADEIQRIQVAAKEQCVREAQRITNELNQIHVAELEKSKSEVEETRRKSVDAEIVEQLHQLHTEELARARMEAESLSLQTMNEKLEEMKILHSAELNQLREDLQTASSDEIDRIRAAEEEQRSVEIERIKNELIESHKAELEKTKSEIMLMANSSQGEQIEQLVVSHREEIERVRSELESLVVQAVEQKANELTSRHAQELQNLTIQLHSSASEEAVRLKKVAEAAHAAEIDHIVGQLKETHSAELQKIKSELVEMANSSQSEQLVQLAASHNDELARVRSEMEASASQAIVYNTEQLSASHTEELNNLRNELESFYSQESQRILAEADERLAEIKRISNDLAVSHAAEIEKVKSEMTLIANGSLNKQLEQLANTHIEDLARVRSEIESTLSQAVEQNTVELSSLHSQEIEKLRNELRVTSFEETKRIQETADEDRQAAIKVVTDRLNDTLSEIARLRQSHEEEIVRTRGVAELTASQALEEKILLMSQTHATDIANLKAESDQLVQTEVQRITNELNEKHAILAMTSFSQTEQIEKLAVAHNEEIERVKADAKQQLAKELEGQRASLISAAKKKHIEKIEEKMKEVNDVHQSEIKRLGDVMASLVAQHNSLKEEYEKMRITSDENLQSLKDEHANMVHVLEKKIAEMTASHEEQIKSQQRGIESERQVSDEKLSNDLMEKTKEVEKVQEDLAAAEKKTAQALQLANKIKKAAMDKMATINEEHAKSLAESQKANEEALTILNAETESLRQTLADSEKQIQELRSSLEHVNSEHERSISEGANEKLQQLSDEHTAAISKLKKDHEKEVAKIEAVYQSKVDVQIQENVDNKAKLQKMMAKHADDLKTHYEGKFKSMKEEEESQLKGMASEIDRLNTDNKSLAKEIDSNRSDVVSLQSALRDSNAREQALLQQMDALKKEIEESSNSVNNTANQMLEQQSKMEEQLKQLAAEKRAYSNQNEELLGKLQALSNNLSMLVEDKKDMEEKLERSNKMLSRYKNAESDLNGLRQENNALKLEQTKTNNALAKLKQEQDVTQLKHGQRTALVGMLEEQVNDLNDSLSDAKAKLEAATYDLSQKGEELESVKRELENAEIARKDAEKKANESSRAVQDNSDNNSIQNTKMIKTLKVQMESLQNQMKKKSSAAQKIINEREAECAELRKTNTFLQHEVDKGSLSDRRIFELAAHQSNRDTAAVAEIKIRDTMIEQLARKLEEGDGDLASAEITVVKAEDQVEQLARVHRREGVNMDYLKSIVVQYLAKPPGSSERSALLPVLATLLQFDSNDYKAIEEGKDKVSWWGEILPTIITGPTSVGQMPSTPIHQAAALLPTSAEVTVSRMNPSQGASSRKSTSLQF